MKICQVVASWEQGGLEKHVIELSNELSKQYQVFVIAHPLMKDKFVETVNFVELDFSQSRWSLRLHFQLLTLLNTLKPDVIHAQANKAALLIKRVKPFLQFKSRYIATLHNQKGNTSMFEGYDKVIVVSPRLAPLIKTSPTIAIYNGVRLPNIEKVNRIYLAQAFNLNPMQPIYIAVGRLVSAKGFDILISAAAKADTQILIVGDGELKAELQQQINALQAKVVLAGFRADVVRLMAFSDGLIISSRFEGGPYTLPEALLLKVPVLSTKVGMVPDFLSEELLVPIEDVDALTQKLIWVQSNPNEWLKKISNVFERAEQDLTLSAMVQKTQAIYAQIVV